MTITRRSVCGVAGALTAGAGMIHAAAATSHRDHQSMFVLFALTAVTQVAVAGALAVRPRRAALLASVLVNTVAAAAWLASRVTGLPFVEGLTAPEAVGLEDLIATVMEAVAVVAALVAARQGDEAGAPALSPAWALFALPGLVGLAAPHSHSGAADAHHVSGATTLAGDPIFAGADTSTASEEQLQAAKELIGRTKEAVRSRFPDEASVVAAGYRSIGDGRFSGDFEHFVNASFLSDRRELDVDHIESIVLERTATGKRIASAMFILEVGKTLADVPDLAGNLAVWHDHQDLCWDLRTMRLAGRLVNGRCVPGGTFLPTPPMLHVWLQDHPCGPFAGIDGHGTACIEAHGH